MRRESFRGSYRGSSNQRQRYSRGTDAAWEDSRATPPSASQSRNDGYHSGRGAPKSYGGGGRGTGRPTGYRHTSYSIRVVGGEDDNKKFVRGNAGSSTSSRPRERQRMKTNEAPTFCRQFTLDGRCRYGTVCRFQHCLSQVAIVQKAHDAGILCCAVAKAPDGAVELYTGSSDNTLRRWQVTPEGPPELGGLAVSLKNTTVFGGGVTSCVFYDDCLFCGLNDGSIKCFHRGSGRTADLQGHSHPVYSLVVIDSVLVSGCWNGDIRLWKFEESTGSFNVANRFTVAGKVFCMREASVAAVNGSAEVTRRMLWVGGSVLVIVDLVSFNIVTLEDCGESNLCMSLVKYENYMLVGFANGGVNAYTFTGEVAFRYEGEFLSSMDGMLGLNGPLLVYGTDKGMIRCVSLPQFEENGFIRAHGHSDVAVVISLGGLHFLTCGKDGTISIWQWIKPAVA